MRIFIGFAEAQREVAEDLGTALRGQGHEVMVDNDDYPPGATPSERQRAAVEGAARFIFLVSPESIARGSSALAALSTARRKWPNPKHGVMTVIAQSVPELPEYLRMANVFDPPGALVPEVVNALYYSRRVHAGRFARTAGVGALVVAAIVGAVYLGLNLRRSPAPSGGGQGATQFELRGSPDFLTWGGEGRYELVNTLPAAAPKYRCEISWEKGRNIESLQHDEACREIRVRAVAKPFVDRSGKPYAEGTYDPEAEGVELTVRGPNGDALWRSLVPVGLMNASVSLTLTGAGVTQDVGPGMAGVALAPGVPTQIAVGIAGVTLPSDFTCKLRNDFGTQNVSVEGQAGSCRMTIVASGGRLPPVLAIEVTHTSGWTGQTILRTQSAGAGGARSRRDAAGDQPGGEAASMVRAAMLAQLTQFCSGQLFCQLKLGVLKREVREVRIGSDPKRLDYRIPGSVLASARSDAPRIFFPAAERVVYVGVEFADGGALEPQRIEISNALAINAVALKRNRGAESVRAYWLQGNEYYLQTQAPIVRAWYDVDGRGFLDASVVNERNLVTLPVAAREVVRFRLELSTGERLDDLEFAVDRGRVSGELAARAERTFIEDGALDCRYERGHAVRAIAPHVMCTPVLSKYELDWVGLKEIRYGAAMDRLDQRVATSLDPQALTGPGWQDAVKVCQTPPGCFAEFRLPSETTDVYVQYVYGERVGRDVMRIVVDATWRSFPPEGTKGRTMPQLMEETKVANAMIARHKSLGTARRLAYNRQERESRR